jgi:hypothetical protein
MSSLHTYLGLLFGAMALLIVLGYVRVRRNLRALGKPKRTFDAYERALRIQEARDRKYGRR